MPESNKVVAHFRDGRLLKGSTQNFLPNRPSFHVLPAAGGAPQEVRCEELKALFFVRSLAGDPGRHSRCGFPAASGEAAHGRRIAVRFRDGELLCGYSLTYQPGRGGFFLFPADAAGNNLRIYVVASAAAEVRIGASAEALVRDLLARAA